MDLNKELERIKKIYFSKNSWYRKKSSPQRLTSIAKKSKDHYDNFYFYRQEFEYMLLMESKSKQNFEN